MADAVKSSGAIRPGEDDSSASFRNKKFLIIGAVVLLFLIVGSYFLNCTIRNPLFLYNRGIGESDYPYRYYFADRLDFCWNFLSQPRSIKSEDRSVAIPIMGPKDKMIISIDSEHPPYNSKPPTSGWNNVLNGKLAVWKTPRRLTYSETVKTEVSVRRLYSGYIWITFRRGEISDAQIEAWRNNDAPEVRIQENIEAARGRLRPSDEVINKLKLIAADTPLVFISASTRQDKDISLNALGRQDKFNLENGELNQEHLDRIWDFILRYRNQTEPAEDTPIKLQPVSAIYPVDSQISSDISEEDGISDK